MKFKGKIIWDKTKPDGTPRKKLNYDRFKSLGWKASIELKNGLMKTIENYRDNYDKGLIRK